jgi:single-strand DNA-binding protein
MPLNKAIICGRLGQDPELKYLPNGNAVANMSVATSESWKDKDGKKQEKTEWHRIVVYGKMAETCNQYLKKGSEAIFEGKLQTRSWDGQDGKKQYITEILVNNVQFVGSAKQSNGQPNGNYQPQGQPQGNYQQRPAGNYQAPQQGQHAQNFNQNMYQQQNANYAPNDIPF